MFIRTSKGYVNTDNIKLYFNHWQKSGKDYNPKGCTIEFVNGDIINVDEHLEADEHEEPIIIPAIEGYETVNFCEFDEGGEPEIWFEPIIAWKIEDMDIIPLSCVDSWKGRVGYRAFRKIGDPRVFSYECTYESVECYKKHLLEKKG